MIRGFRELDSILRGDATQTEALRGSDGSGEIGLPGTRMLDTLVILGLAYGLCMGSYALFRTYLSPEETVVGVGGAWGQLFASMVKVPLLFVLTLVVTTPSLYVFNALCGSRLGFASMMKLLLAMLGVTLAVLAALGPIVAFFGVTSTSYAFMKLLNVVFFAAAGFIGLTFLLRTLHRLVMVQSATDTAAAEAPERATTIDADGPPGDATVPETTPEDSVTVADPPKASAAAAERERWIPTLARTDERTDRRAQTVFNCWLILFGLVGAQMSWVLRPFIGNPDQPFSLFRDREGNFFADVFAAFLNLLGG